MHKIERIVLVYKTDKSWDVYFSGEFIFNAISYKEVLTKLEKMMSVLD